MRMVIRCDGTIEQLDAPVSIKDICRIIGADTLDTVNLRHLGHPLQVMCVDDLGYETRAEDIPGADNATFMRPVRALKPVNVKATALYHASCIPGTTHQIVGDVVVVPDGDFAGYGL